MDMHGASMRGRQNDLQESHLIGQPESLGIFSLTSLFPHGSNNPNLTGRPPKRGNVNLRVGGASVQVGIAKRHGAGGLRRDKSRHLASMDFTDQAEVPALDGKTYGRLMGGGYADWRQQPAIRVGWIGDLDGDDRLHRRAPINGRAGR